MQPRTPSIDEQNAARMLRVHVDAGSDEVRARFRMLAKVAHPDRSAGHVATDIGRLAEARDVLLARAERRAQYRERVRAANEDRRRTLMKARSRTLFDDHLVDLTTPLGHLVDVTG